MERDRTVIETLNELVARRPQWGFWKLYDRLRLDGADSGRCRPLIPEYAGPVFRAMSGHHSGACRHRV